jgi:NAD(P)-dependent dehydrogenase (short-subunit alcohol dehydrogenase family)
MKKGTYDNPLKWLLAELPGYIEPPALAMLMEAYEANKAAYYRQVKIRHAKRQLRLYEGRNGATAAVARWHAKLQQLESEQG